MSSDIYIGKFSVNIGNTSYKVFDDVLVFTKELDNGCLEDSYGLGCLDGLAGWQAIEVLKEGFNQLKQYGRKPLKNEPEAMLHMGQMVCACVYEPYTTIRVY